VRRGDRRHPAGFTPEVIATIDVSSEICMVGMLDSLSLKNTKLGLETLDLMGYDTTASRSCSTGPTRGSGSRPTTSRRSSAAPGRFIPSDREIPRSINEGTPIVAARPTSGAAKAFRSLADRYTKTPVSQPAPKQASSSGVRSLIGRRR
jgi:ATPases involved in chromosome partitioning